MANYSNRTELLMKVIDITEKKFGRPLSAIEKVGLKQELMKNNWNYQDVILADKQQMQQQVTLHEIVVCQDDAPGRIRVGDVWIDFVEKPFNP